MALHPPPLDPPLAERAKLIFICVPKCTDLHNLFSFKTFGPNNYGFSDTEATFVLPLKEATVTEDEFVELTCELSKSDALVKWFKDGVELAASDHVSFETAGTKRSMKIGKSVMEDSAMYQCQITTSGASSQAQLTVTGLLACNLFLLL